MAWTRAAPQGDVTSSEDGVSGFTHHERIHLVAPPVGHGLFVVAAPEGTGAVAGVQRLRLDQDRSAREDVQPPPLGRFEPPDGTVECVGGVPHAVPRDQTATTKVEREPSEANLGVEIPAPDVVCTDAHLELEEVQLIGMDGRYEKRLVRERAPRVLDLHETLESPAAASEVGPDARA